MGSRYICSFVQIKRINHVVAVVGTNHGVGELYQQQSFLRLFLERDVLQRDARLEEDNGTGDVVSHTDGGLRGNRLEGVPPQGAAVVVAVHTLAWRGAEEDVQALLDILLVGGHPYAAVRQHGREAPAAAQESVGIQQGVQFVHISLSSYDYRGASHRYRTAVSRAVAHACGGLAANQHGGRAFHYRVRRPGADA